MPVQKKTVEFIDDVVILDHNKEVDQSFKAGQVIELSRLSAERHIRRGKAKFFVGKAPAAGNATQTPPGGSTGLTAKHKGFGKWNVVNAAGEVVAADLKKDAARAMVAG